jgi:hypothetical protein
VSLCLFISLHLFLCLSLSFSVSFCLSLSLSASLCVSPCLSLFLCVSLCLSMTPSISLSLSLCLSLSLSLSVPICLSLSLFVSFRLSLSLCVSSVYHLCCIIRLLFCITDKDFSGTHYYSLMGPYISLNLLSLLLAEHSNYTILVVGFRSYRLYRKWIISTRFVSES